MTASSAAVRAAAARAIDQVLNQGRSLDTALAHASQPAAARPLLAQFCYGVLRHWRALDWLLHQLMNKPLAAREGRAQALIALGVFELWQMQTPAHASVSETVNAMRLIKRPALGGLCNALLRRFQRESEALLAQLDRQTLGVRESHPDWLVERLRADWPEHADAIVTANNARAPMWLRVNRRHGSTSDYAVRLREAIGLDAVEVVEAPQALRLERPVDVASLPGFADGDVSVQDLAPQAVGLLAGVEPGMRVLDACAAPGGKTAHLLELADNQLDMTALDIDAARLQRVSETLARLKLDANCIAADAARTGDWWDGRPFDRVIVDAPCTATGVIRRHPDIKWLRRPDDVAVLAGRQQQLLSALAPLVAPEGCLVFATCSVLREENHGVIQQFTGSEPNFQINNELRADNISGLMTVEPTGMQFLPGEAQADGFFVSRLVRRA